MHSHVIVMTFDREREAPRVFESLQQMRGSPLLGLENAVVVTRDSRGGLTVAQKRELSRTQDIHNDALVNSSIQLLFGDPPAEMVDALVEKGFDCRFWEHIVKEMGNDASALLILVTRDSQVDRSRLLSILTLFRGRIFETTLPPAVEDVLAKGWEA